MKAFKFSILLPIYVKYSILTAQIGIGTATPKAALDIVSSTQGILPPRMTGAQILGLTVGADQNSMLLYATSTSGAISKIGYWYYDHTSTSWKPFDSDITATNGINIASNNIRLGGALTQATTISGLTATNKMSFTGTGTDAFNIDGATFSVDATNDRIGIGTSSPTNKLHVAGNALFAPRTTNDGTGGEPVSVEVYGRLQTATGQVGGLKMYWYSNSGGIEVIRGGASNDGMGLAFNVSNISSVTTEAMRLTRDGNMGVGTTAPARKLEITSGASTTPSIRLTNQTASATSSSTNRATNLHSLVVDASGDVHTIVKTKYYTPNNCACATTPYPYTLPADLTSFETYDGNWSGNGQGNTTLADFILPSASNAYAAGHKTGDIVVIYRDASYNSVMGTTNTDMASNLLLIRYKSYGFVLVPEGWRRIF